LERGDYSSAEWAHPEIEFVLADGPDPGSWTGLVGVAEGWRDRLDELEAGEEGMRAETAVSASTPKR
jgi:hypothetical protein